MPDPDPERIADIVSELLDGVSSDHPAQRGVVLGELVRRLVEYGLYRFAPDDGSSFAAGLNHELLTMAARYGNGNLVWQLIQCRLVAASEEVDPPHAVH